MTETALQPWEQTYTVLMRDGRYYVIDQQARDRISAVLNTIIAVEINGEIEQCREIKSIRKTRREDYLLRQYPERVQTVVNMRIQRFIDGIGKIPSEEQIVAWAEKAQLGEAL